MPDFSCYTDEQVLTYLLEHYNELEVGAPDTDLFDGLLKDARNGTLAIEKRDGAFAVVARANRKHAGMLGQLIVIPPQADLVYLMVAAEARSKGTGTALLAQLKNIYMEDQAMELVCAGAKRKAFFERCGFVAENLTEEGLHYMVCPARVPSTD